MPGSSTESKPLFLAQDRTLVPVHVISSSNASSRSVCGLHPQPEWNRVWREAISLRELPEGVCRECWHSTRFAETFAAALQ